MESMLQSPSSNCQLAEHSGYQRRLKIESHGRGAGLEAHESDAVLEKVGAAATSTVLML